MSDILSDEAAEDGIAKVKDERSDATKNNSSAALLVDEPDGVSDVTAQQSSSVIVEDRMQSVAGDSAVVADEPSVVAEDSSVVVEDSSVVADEPSVVAEDSFVVADEPSVVVEESSMVVEETSAVAEDSSVAEQEIEQSEKTTADDVDKASEPDAADDKAQRYGCTSCSKTFARKSEYVKHQYIHRENPQMSCGPCNKGFTTELQLRRHNNAHHKVATASSGGRKQHICNHCAAVFRTNKALEQHHVAEHVAQKEYVCRVCGAEFSWEVNLKRHELVHEVNPHSCRLCNREFVDQTSLRVHIRNVHKPNPANPMQPLEPGQIQQPIAMLKKYVCATCGRGFQFDFSYIAHMNAHVMPGQSTGVDTGAPSGYSLQDAVKRVAEMTHPPAAEQPHYVELNPDGVIELGVMGGSSDHPGEIIVEIYDDCAGQTYTTEPGSGEEVGIRGDTVPDDAKIESKQIEIESMQTHVEIKVNARKLSGKKVQPVRASERSPTKNVQSKTLEEVAAETVVKAKKFWSLKKNKNNNHKPVALDVVVGNEEKVNDAPVVDVANAESKEAVEPPSQKKFWSLRGKKNNGKVVVAPEVVVEDEGVDGSKVDVTNEQPAIVIEKSWSLRGAKKNNKNVDAEIVVVDNDVTKTKKLNAESDKGKSNAAGKLKIDKKSTDATPSKKFGKNARMLANVAPEAVTDEDWEEGDEMDEEDGGEESPRRGDDNLKGKRAKSKQSRGRVVQPVEPVQVKPVRGRPVQVKPVPVQPVQVKPVQGQTFHVNPVVVGSVHESLAPAFPPRSESAPKVHPRVNTEYNYIPARLMPKPKKPIRAKQPFLFNCVMTPEKPFECQFCGETFRWEISLDIHTKIHTEGMTPRLRKSMIQAQLDGKSSTTPPAAAAQKLANTKATRTPSVRTATAGKLKSPPEVLESSIVDKHALSDEENHEDEEDEYGYPSAAGSKVNKPAAASAGRGRRARVEPVEDEVEEEEDDPNDLAAYLTSGGQDNTKKSKKKEQPQEKEDGDNNEDDDPNDLAAYLTSGGSGNSMKKKKEERPTVGSSGKTTVRDNKNVLDDVGEGEVESLVRNSGPGTKAIKRRKVDVHETVTSAKKNTSGAEATVVKEAASVAEAHNTRSRRTANNTQQTPAAATSSANNDSDKKVCDVFTADDFLLMMTDNGQKALSPPSREKTKGAASTPGSSADVNVQPARRVSNQSKKNGVVTGNSSAIAKKRGIANLKNVKKVGKRVTKTQGRSDCIPRPKGGDPKRDRKNFFKILQWQKVQSTNKRSALPCSCGIVLSTKLALNRHRLRYHVPGVFACVDCAPSKKKFSSRLSLARHRRRTHTGNSFECRRCGNVYRTNAELSRHRALHGAVKCPLMCKLCQKRFFVRERLEQHEAAHASNGEITVNAS